jgi:hypothetical protein
MTKFVLVPRPFVCLEMGSPSLLQENLSFWVDGTFVARAILLLLYYNHTVTVIVPLLSAYCITGSDSHALRCFCVVRTKYLKVVTTLSTAISVCVWERGGGQLVGECPLESPPAQEEWPVIVRHPHLLKRPLFKTRKSLRKNRKHGQGSRQEPKRRFTGEVQH